MSPSSLTPAEIAADNTHPAGSEQFQANAFSGPAMRVASVM